MPRKQTRRSVSVKGETYDKITVYCKQHGMAKSALIERLIEDFFIKQKDPMGNPPVPAVPRGPRGGGVNEF
jgi:hypothetical protein